MFFHEKTYDIDELVKWNLHLHTTFSGCAKPEMKVRDIVRVADEAGLEMIALLKMIPYVFTVLVLIIISIRDKKENQPPAALGLPYFREER